MTHDAPTTSAAPLSALTEEQHDDRGQFVLLVSKDSLVEAEMVKSRLEAEGLAVQLSDDTTVGLAPHLAGALGGVGVEVREGDLEKAQALLEQRHAGSGGPTFRVLATQGSLGLMVGSLVGAAPAAVLASQGLAGIGAGLVLAGVAGGYLWGASRRRDYCSRLGCAHLLSPDDTACPGCGGAIVGDLKDASERLAAEETYKESLKD